MAGDAIARWGDSAETRARILRAAREVIEECGYEAANFAQQSPLAGFSVDQTGTAVIAEQLHQLMTHGLLDQQVNGRALTVAPPVPAVVAVDDFRPPWSGLTG